MVDDLSQAFQKLLSWWYKRKFDRDRCWHNKGYILSTGAGENFLCSKCGAFLNNTPFGIKLLNEDYRNVQSDAEKYYKVEKWEFEKRMVDVIQEMVK